MLYIIWEVFARFEKYIVDCSQLILLFKITKKEDCLNKMGHSLHWHDPIFKEVTFSQKAKKVAKDLQFVDPVVVQGTIHILRNHL